MKFLSQALISSAVFLLLKGDISASTLSFYSNFFGVEFLIFLVPERKKSFAHRSILSD